MLAVVDPRAIRLVYDGPIFIALQCVLQDRPYLLSLCLLGSAGVACKIVRSEVLDKLCGVGIPSALKRNYYGECGRPSSHHVHVPFDDRVGALLEAITTMEAHVCPRREDPGYHLVPHVVGFT